MPGLLVLDGGTLQYTGPTASTDRTFTITANGGTIDGSGSGPVTFSSAGGAEVANSAIAGSGNRTLTLTGSTTGNVLAGQLADGTGGVTNLTKAGNGSWILTNSGHTYTGTTSVTAGTLGLSSATSNNLIATSSTISVGPSGTLDVTGLPSSTITLGAQTLTGSGSVNGSVLNSAVSTIAPGTIVAGSSQSGTLTVGNLSLASGSTLNFGLSSANLASGSLTGADLISTGLLTMPSSGAIAQFFVPGTSNQFTGTGLYDLVHYTSLSGSINNTTMTVGNGNGAFSYTFGTSNNYLTVNIIQLAVAATWNDGNIVPNQNPGLWSNSANWLGGTPGGNVGDTATFGSTTSAPSSGAPITSVSLDEARTLGGITFNNSNSYTISDAASFVLTMDNGATNPATIHDQSGSHQINVPVALAEASTALATVVTVDNAADTLTMSGPISGNGSLTKAGLGTLILSNTGSNYAGNTNVNAGVLRFSALSSLGSGANIKFGGGTLQYATGNTADISTRTVSLNAGGGTIDTNGNNVTFAGAIGNSGAGGFTKTGAGTLTLLSTSNTYSGNTAISGGTLNFAALNSLGTGTGITASNGATLQWASGNAADISTRTVTVGAGGVTFDANGSALNFTGPIGNGGVSAVTFTSSAPGGSFTLNRTVQLRRRHNDQ